MELAYDMLDKTLRYYLINISVMVVIIIICFVGTIRSKNGGNKMAIYSVALVVWLCVYSCGSVVPFLKDYFAKNIVIVDGIYQNSDNSKSKSAVSGLHPVTVECEREILELTTAPWNDHVFVMGEHEVVAYYAPNSKLLLHIEIK